MGQLTLRLNAHIHSSHWRVGLENHPSCTTTTQLLSRTFTPNPSIEMSFGISVGDFIAVGQLAWRLYQDCYRVARGAPHEFRQLIDELKTLYTNMKLFEGELEDPNSVLVKAGEERLQMVKDLLEKVKQVLKGLNDSFNKHRKLGNVTRKGLKAMWDQFQWARYAKDVDGLRHRVGAQISTSGWD